MKYSPSRAIAQSIQRTRARNRGKAPTEKPIKKQRKQWELQNSNTGNAALT
jgi:hypothetical protein